MVNLIEIVENGDLIVLLAPTGSGKTHFVLNSLRTSGRKLVFISPLKALALEFFKKAGPKSLFLEGAEGRDEFKSLKWDVCVATPEAMGDSGINLLMALDPRPLFILDEIHLFKKWGESFRPYLLTFLENLGVLDIPILGMTATLEKDVIEWLQREMTFGFERVEILDFKNMEMKHIPENHVLFPRWSKKIFNYFFIEQMKKREGLALYFCSSRREVVSWVDFFNWLDIPALGCVGGETMKFMESYEENKTPRVIFSTTALSHGVNLGTVDEVYISYFLNLKDLWVQMASRGGRTGKPFSVYSFDDFFKMRGRVKFFGILLKFVGSRLRGNF